MTRARLRHIRCRQRCSARIILAETAREITQHGGDFSLAQTRLCRHDPVVGDSAHLEIAHQTGGNHHHEVVAALGYFCKGHHLLVQGWKAAGYASRLRAVTHGAAIGEDGRAPRAVIARRRGRRLRGEARRADAERGGAQCDGAKRIGARRSSARRVGATSDQ